MAVPPRSAVTLPVLGVLWVLCALLGATIGAGPAAAAAPTVRGGHPPVDPYSGRGLLLRLPDGGHVRLVLPQLEHRMPPHRGGGHTPPRPPAKSAPTPPAPTGHPDTGRPDTGRPGSGGPAAPGDTLSALPIPLVKPLFSSGPGRHTGSGGAHGPAGPAAPAGAGGHGAPARAGRSQASPAAAPSSPGSPARTHRNSYDYYQDDWPPVPVEPPPLGPQALARPQSAAVPEPAQQATTPTGYSDELLRRRLLPLGVGLALIGVGAALFGWKLRRL